MEEILIFPYWVEKFMQLLIYQNFSMNYTILLYKEWDLKMENLVEFNLFTVKNVIIYLIIINLIGFYVMWSDKRKAQKGKWRIPENTLFLITLLGGGIGTIAGMYTFRHKTKKLKFTIGLPAILILEIILFIYLKFII